MRIGLLNLTRLGDLVQTTPLLAGLRRRHPDAEIHLIVKTRFREMAAMLPGVDEIHEFDGDAMARVLAGPEASFSRAYARAREVVDALSGVPYDLLLNLTHSRVSAVLLSLMDARRRVGYQLDRLGQRRVENPWLVHMGTIVRARRLNRFNLVDVYLGAAGLSGCREPLRVRVGTDARASAERLLPGDGRYVAVQLGASTDTKTWNSASWARTLRALAERAPDVRPVLVGVEAERERADALRAQLPPDHCVDLIAATRVPELAAVLERCALLLTADTGTMHLAAAVGTRTCCVFVGLGNPWETGAYGEGHVSLMSRIACAPCRHDVVCGYPACHDDIPPAWLAALVHGLLDGREPAELPPLERADVFRSAFDPNGQLDQLPLTRRAPQAHDLMSLAYRAAFVEALDGTPAEPQRVFADAAERYGAEPGEWKGLLPADLCERLGEVGVRAREAGDLVRQLRSGPAQGAALERIGSGLARIDREIYAAARAQPLLAPLALHLEGSLEALPDADLSEVAAASLDAYGQTAHLAERLHGLIAGEAEAKYPTRPMPRGV